VRDDVVSRKLARENEAFRALEQLPMPVIAALNGVALGGDSFCSWSRVFLELNDELHDASETWWAREDSNLKPERYERSARLDARVRSTGVARKCPGPTDANGGRTR